MKKFTLMALALICSMGAFADNWYFNGNAAPGSWSDNSETNQTRAFTEDAQGNLVWIGKLVTGGEGFKIGRNGNDFGGWGDVHPSTPGLDITVAGTDTYVEGGDDTKWTVAEEGIYKLTLDPGTQTLKCEAYTPSIQQVDGWYEVGTAEQLYEFAELVSHDAIPSNCNVRLTDDIEFDEYHYTTIGRSGAFPFRGTFDGQAHKIKISLYDIFGRTGFFSYINTATIKNLEIYGSVTMEHHNCGGGLGGRSDGDGTKIENVLVETTIEYNYSNGDATVGGLFANMEGNVILKNCIFAGIINTRSAEGNGGLIGWAGGGSRVNIQNCLVAAYQYTKNGNSADFARNNPSVSDSYFVTWDDARLSSGELCFLLNGKVSGGENWIQNLANQFLFPVPAHSSSYYDALTPNLIYANGSFNCDGTAKEGVEIVYSNVDENITDPHVFGENGVCTACHKVGQEPEHDGENYLISNFGNLMWIADAVNAGLVEDYIYVILQNDIEQGDAIYTPIGSAEHPFVGQFMGGDNSVTLNLKNGAYSRQGLFGTVSAVSDYTGIYGVTVKGNIEAADYAAGVVAAVQNADFVFIQGCANEANVTASGANAAGILGVNFSGKVEINNCYNAGAIKGGRESAAISGWLGNDALVVKTYNCGTVEGVDGEKTFARWSSGQYVDCYNTLAANEVDGRVDSYPMEKVQSGELCYTLGTPFTQNLGEDAHPVFGHEVVDFVNGEYVNPWYPAFDTSMYYTLTNKIKTDAYWHGNGTDNILCYPKAEVEDYYWAFEPTKNKNCFTIKNVLSGKYVQAHGDATQVEILLGDEPAEYYIAYCEAEDAYGLASTNATVYDFTAGCVGLNLKKDPNEEGCCVQTFAAVAGTNHRSFWLLDSVDPVATSISNATVDTVKVAKIIENGQIVILRNGVKYNAAGVQMK